jgi:hypothetical protein
MPTRTTSNERAAVALPASRRRTLALAAALGLAAAAAACSGRDRARRQVDADLGHDLDLASTTGIELANRGGRGTQVVSAIEETPRTAPHHSSSPKPTSAGHRRHKVAKKQEADAPPATVMVADHEVMGPASVEKAAGSDSTSNAPSTEGPNAGPAITPEPQPYPAGGGGDAGRGNGGGGGGVIGIIGAILRDAGRGNGGGGGGVIGIIGAILRGGMGGVDRCDERHGHGRHGGGGVIVVPGGGPPMIPSIPDRQGGGGWPGGGRVSLPRR